MCVSDSSLQSSGACCTPCSLGFLAAFSVLELVGPHNQVDQPTPTSGTQLEGPGRPGFQPNAKWWSLTRAGSCTSSPVALHFWSQHKGAWRSGLVDPLDQALRTFHEAREAPSDLWGQLRGLVDVRSAGSHDSALSLCWSYVCASPIEPDYASEC